MQEIKKYAQLALETHARPTKKPQDGARVLGIQAAEDASLSLKGTEAPSRANTRTENQRHRPPHQQDG